MITGRLREQTLTFYAQRQGINVYRHHSCLLRAQTSNQY